MGMTEAETDSKLMLKTSLLNPLMRDLKLKFE